MSNPARTGTQKALHVVSIIMIVLGVLVILSGASLIALGVSAVTMGMDQPMTLGDTETTADTTSVALGIIVLAMGKYMRSREKGRGDGRNDKAGEGRASLAAGDYVGGNADPLGSPSGLGR